MTKYATLFACLLLAFAGIAQAQFGLTGTTTLSVTVAPEAALSVVSATTLAAVAGTFSNPYIGTTNLTYKIRTLKSTGSGSITLKVTADFGNGTGTPSVASPPTAGDALSYTCTVSSPGTACSSSPTPPSASTTASTPVATFGPGQNSVSAGNSASVAWSLTNDPAYATGTYTATVTFTISAA